MVQHAWFVHMVSCIPTFVTVPSWTSTSVLLGRHKLQFLSNTLRMPSAKFTLLQGGWASPQTIKRTFTLASKPRIIDESQVHPSQKDMISTLPPLEDQQWIHLASYKTLISRKYFPTPTIVWKAVKGILFNSEQNAIGNGSEKEKMLTHLMGLITNFSTEATIFIFLMVYQLLAQVNFADIMIVYGLEL